jgi:hypothetical protein
VGGNKPVNASHFKEAAHSNLLEAQARPKGGKGVTAENTPGCYMML